VVMSAAADVVATAPVERRASRLSTVDAQDEEVLAQLGYKQELRRDWGLMHNFGISFSIIVCFTPSANASSKTKPC